jgi:hypothetical protein
MLPTGKVMFYAYTDGPYLWDPATAAISPAAPAGFNLFCTGHSFLPDGRLFVAGGHIENNVGLPNSSVYNPFTNTWTDQPLMNAGRWYPTNTTLPNGDVLVVSGDIDRTVWNNILPQVWQLASGTWRDLTSAQLGLPLYPSMFVAPNGRVFNAGPQQTTRYLDTSGTGSWSFVADHNYGAIRDYGPAVMYDVGKILIVGGGDPPTATAEVIDLQTATPRWRNVAPMSVPRRQHNATLLPDGSVLVSGGSSGPGWDNADAPVYGTELWNPTSETWTPLAPMTQYRGYHSTALLLPDGRVLSSGGDNHPNAEVFSPPYLFKGARPSITSVPSTWNYGQQFDIQTPDAASITAVNLIRLSAVTHTFNQDQRIVRLSFTAGSGVVRATAPSNRNLAPPGPYMVFLLNGNGVPSVGRIMKIADGSVLAAPDHLTATAASANRVNLSWTDQSTAEDGFRIERATGTSSTFSVVGTVGQNGSSYTDFTVAASTSYTYRVVAFNGTGSATSTTVTVTTPNSGSTAGGVRRFNGTTDYIDFPSAPQASTISIGFFFTPLSLPATGQRDVLVTYGEQGSAEPFATNDKQLFLAPDGTLKARVYTNGSVIATSTTKLRVGQRYHVGFTAGTSTLTLYVNGAVESAVAAPGSYAGYTDPLLRLAGLPTPLESGTTSTRANGDITAFGEWRVALTSAQMASLASGAAVTSVDAGSLVVAASLTDDPPTADVGGPILVNGTSFVATGSSPPAAPTGLSATAISANRVDLRWTDQSTSEDGFRVLRGTGTATPTTIATVAANVTSFSDLTVSPSTTYSYVIEAFNSAGTSRSASASATTPASTTGGTGGVRRFNGTTDYIDFPSAPQVSAVTIGFFFTPQSLPATGERDVLATYGEQGTAEPFTSARQAAVPRARRHGESACVGQRRCDCRQHYQAGRGAAISRRVHEQQLDADGVRQRRRRRGSRCSWFVCRICRSGSPSGRASWDLGCGYCEQARERRCDRCRRVERRTQRRTDGEPCRRGKCQQRPVRSVGRRCELDR